MKLPIEWQFMAILAVIASPCLSNENKWSQEVGWYYINPDVDSSVVTGAGLPPNTAVDVQDGNAPLFTTTYHQNDNLSYEFFYSWWNELDAEASGSISSLGNIGSFEYLAPTLMVNWTFGDTSWVIRPYLGAGINRMIYGNEESNANLDAALGGPTSVKLDDTWGHALTAGLTWDIGSNFYATLSYVQIQTDTEAELKTPAVGTTRHVDLDTTLQITYLNFGYRF